MALQGRDEWFDLSQITFEENSDAKRTQRGHLEVSEDFRLHRVGGIGLTKMAVDRHCLT